MYSFINFYSQHFNGPKIKNIDSPFLRNIRNDLNSTKFFETGNITSNISTEDEDPLINCKDLDVKLSVHLQFTYSFLTFWKNLFSGKLWNS